MRIAPINTGNSTKFYTYRPTPTTTFRELVEQVSRNANRI